MAFIEEDIIEDTVMNIQGKTFTILDFMETFRKLYPDEWDKLVKKYGLYGSKKRYTSATYLSNRLYTYSKKPESQLKSFVKFKKGGKGDYRRATEKEREIFGSPWIAIYKKKS